MAHYGTLEGMNDIGKEEIRGSDLFGVNEEKLGTIHDVIFDHENGNIRYVVVDTGGWLSHKYFLVPAGYVRPYGRDKDLFYADLTRAHVEAFPPYDKDVVGSDENFRDYERRYEQA